MSYLKEIIPNFRHFVVHPDAVNFDSKLLIDFLKSDNLLEYISFENMDIRKSSHKTTHSMSELFAKFPELRFTLDVNHSLEN
jgi:hypothetical protein